MAKKAGKPAAKKKMAKAKPKLVAASSRRIKQIEPKWWQLGQRLKIKHPVKLPGAWQLTKTSAQTLWQNKNLFGGITIVYGLLNLILVQGLASSSNVSSLKSSLDQVFSGHFGAIGSSLSVFAVLVGSAGNSSSQTAGAYQLFLALIASLAVIWSLRQVFSGSSLRVRDAYYRGMYPLIPFLLVLLVIGLQLIPLTIGASVYSLVVTNGIAVGGFEKFLWLLQFIVLASISLYMLSSSLFALYIVTLPDMTPLKALRSARQLVRHRRPTVLRKILWLPVVLLMAAAIIMVPIIIWLTPLAQWIFFILTMFSLVAAHAYMYSLYRELLNE